MRCDQVGPASSPLVQLAGGCLPQAVLESISDNLLVVDLHYIVSFTNSRAKSASGAPSNEAPDNTCHGLLAGRSSPCEDDNCLVRRVKLTRYPATRIYAPLAAQGRRCIEAQGYPVFDISGNVAYVAIVCHDNTAVAASRLGSAALDEAERRKAREAAALARVARAIGGTLDIKAILETVGQQVIELFQADRCAVLLLEEDGCTLSMPFAAVRDCSLGSWRNVDSVPIHVDRVWRVVLSRRQVIALDRVITRQSRSGEELEQRAILVAPLMARDRPLGIMYVDVVGRDRVWSEEDRAIAAALADQAAMAIDNARAYALAEKKIREVQVINDVAQAVSSSLDLREITRRAIECLKGVVKFDRASLFVVGEQGEVIAALRTGDSTTTKLAQDPRWLAEDTTPGWVIKNRQAWIDRDIKVFSRFPEDPILLEEGVRSKLVVPLISNNAVIGTLNLASHQPETYSERDLAVLLPVAAQLAPAVVNARLYEETRRTNRELAAMYAVAAAVSSSLRIEDVVNSCLNAISGTVECDGLGLVVWETNREMPALKELRGVCHRIAAFEEPSADSVIWQVMRSGEMAVFADTTSCADRPELAELGARPVVVAPIKRNNVVHGVLCVVGVEHERFRREDIQLLEVICGQIGDGIERSRLYSEVHKKASEFRALFEVGRDVSASLDLQTILRSTVANARQLLGADVSFITLVSEEGTCVVVEAGAVDEEIRDLEVLASQQECMLSVPLVIEDLSATEALTPELLRSLVQAGLQSALVVPLLTDDNMCGVLYIANRARTAFSPEDMALVGAFANQVGLAIKNARLHDEVRQLAVTDGLTGLYNHRYFYQRLAEEFDRAKRFHRPLALIFIDIDDLKVVNDTFGHVQGDAILREIAVLLKSSVRSTDIVARYGGDEICIILPETDLAEAVAVGERLHESFERCRLSCSAKVTVSIGISSLDEGADSVTELVRRADAAAYRAKMLGKGRICVYESSV